MINTSKENILLHKPIERNTKVWVIGIDAMTFNLINQWINEGEMPNFAKLLKTSVYGSLRSTIPPVTPPAWTSLVTGKNPDKHGVVDFQISRGDHLNKTIVTSRDRDAEAIWNILGNYGKKVGIVGVPVTYPPERVNGFMISGYLTPPQKTDFSYPPNIKDELVNEVGSCRPEIKEFSPGKNSFIKEVFDHSDENIRITHYLLKKYDIDFFMIVFMGIDLVQHIFWKYMDKTHPCYDSFLANKYADVILKLYKKFDRFIGNILENMDESTTLIIVSDHGCGPVYKVFYVHNWLKSIGLLEFKNDISSNLSYEKILEFFFSDSKILTPSVQRLLSHIRSLIPERWLRKMVKKPPHGFSSPSNVEWGKTKAYHVGLKDIGQININLKGREPEGIVEPGDEYEELRNYLVKKLYSIEDTETKEKIVDKVYKREELYSGKYVERLPDLFFITKGMRYLVENYSYEPEKIFDLPKNFSAIHRMDGVLIIKGPDIKKNTQIRGANITDITPTILHIFGIPLPKDVDGRVLREIFKPCNVDAKRKPPYLKLYQKEVIKRRVGELKAAGRI